MTDYKSKRIDYVNRWPYAPIFDMEQAYQNRCEDFKSKHGEMPFLPMPLWNSAEKEYHIFVSKLIESLEMMPLWPNRAFSFLFSGFDYYSKQKIGEENITIRLKRLSSSITQLADNSETVKNILNQLFAHVPMSVAAYVYKREFLDEKVLNRLAKDVNNKKAAFYGLLREINANYDYTDADSAIRRKAAALIRRLFRQDNFVINDKAFSMNDEARLHILLSGLIYTLRNDTLHGSSIAITKSSQTTISRYALNYYAFVALYTISMLLIISEDDVDRSNERYSTLLVNVSDNMKKMKLLFGNYLGK